MIFFLLVGDGDQQKVNISKRTWRLERCDAEKERTLQCTTQQWYDQWMIAVQPTQLAGLRQQRHRAASHPAPTAHCPPHGTHTHACRHERRNDPRPLVPLFSCFRSNRRFRTRESIFPPDAMVLLYIFKCRNIRSCFGGRAHPLPGVYAMPVVIVIGCGTRSASSAVMRSVNFLACELVNERKEESSAMCVCTFGAFVQSVE